MPISDTKPTVEQDGVVDAAPTAGLATVRAQSNAGEAWRDLALELEPCTGCGHCNPVCPTYLATADERDGPRGRIAIMQMLATGRDRDASGVLDAADHWLSRCVGCGACEPACPERVRFASALGLARALIDGAPGERPAGRLKRALVDAMANPERPKAGRLARLWGRAQSQLARAQRSGAGARQFGPAMWQHEPAFDGPGVASTDAERRGRVLLLPGCTQLAFRPNIADSVVRLLARRGYDVEIAAGQTCCGALDIQVGRLSALAAAIEANLAAWSRADVRARQSDGAGPFTALLTTGAVCTTALAAYPQRSRSDGRATPIYDLIAKARDVLTFLAGAEFGAPEGWSSLRIGYVGACLSRGGRAFERAPDPELGRRADLTPDEIDRAAVQLLREAGYAVRPRIRDGQCCGGLGIYPWINQTISRDLADRTLDGVRGTEIDVLAVADVSCQLSLSEASGLPVVHVVELLDWAYGGPCPPGLERFADHRQSVPKGQADDRASAPGDDGSIG